MFLPSVPIDCLWGICIIISSILNNIRMKVKVGFIEGAEEWQINFFLRRFQKIDGSVLEFEIDKERADFLIAFPWLYMSSRENYLQFLEESRGKIVIMDVLGEALAPNLNLFDYHIGFDAPDDDGRLLCMSYLFDLRMKLKDLHTMNPMHYAGKTDFAIIFIPTAWGIRTASSCFPSFPPTRRWMQ